MARNSGEPILQNFLEPAGREQITGLSVVKGFASIPALAKIAMVQPESKNIRWRDDGVSPSATVGMILVANDILVYSGTMATFKMIEVSASAKVNVNYYK